MNLELSKDEKLIKSSAREFLEKECTKDIVREIEESESGYSEALWKKMAELGWMGLVIPEEYGGVGLEFIEFVSLSALMEEIGRSLLPSPFFSTIVLGALTILEAGNKSLKEKFLPEIAEGKLKLSLALIEPSATYKASGVEAKAVAVSDGYQINGKKLFVEYGHVADFLICAARTKEGERPEQGITLFFVDAKNQGVKIEQVPTTGLERQCTVYFEDVFVPNENIIGDPDKGWTIIEDVLHKASVAKCAEMLGGMQACLDMTNGYVKRRVQYGHVIGSYQAIQYYLAEAWIDMVSSIELVYEAASAIEKGLPYRLIAQMAKAWVGNAMRRISAKCLHMHGAIGMTKEYDIGLYYRQAKSWDLSCGSADSHLSNLGEAIKEINTRDFFLY